ncbi:hypothetical protein PCCS19_42040 [Paenibacillus sp. CCS19]|uniref:hypothetical protein n=1 Tax=Paenibacillus sp. CCS19 TaxID=3158387 RepID=UPI00255DE7D7|nr:hypothetical protein [Paenibacillus cellulosilyticus]GMK41148.1 hypothetical protein PCCS19_42040 [Paenibacillus cellulosilyticus]
MHEYNEQFYCVCCNQLLRKREADILFRTGYFRVVYPLGCCVACERRERHTTELPDHPRLITGSPVFRIEPLTDMGSAGIGVHRIASGSDVPLYWNDQAESKKTMNLYH